MMIFSTAQQNQVQKQTSIYLPDTCMEAFYYLTKTHFDESLHFPPLLQFSFFWTFSSSKRWVGPLHLRCFSFCLDLVCFGDGTLPGSMKTSSDIYLITQSAGGRLVNNGSVRSTSGLPRIVEGISYPPESTHDQRYNVSTSQPELSHFVVRARA